MPWLTPDYCAGLEDVTDDAQDDVGEGTQSFAGLTFTSAPAFNALVIRAANTPTSRGQAQSCDIKTASIALHCQIEPQYELYSLLSRRDEMYWAPNTVEQTMIDKKMQCEFHPSPIVDHRLIFVHGLTTSS